MQNKKYFSVVYFLDFTNKFWKLEEKQTSTYDFWI